MAVAGCAGNQHVAVGALGVAGVLAAVAVVVGDAAADALAVAAVHDPAAVAFDARNELGFAVL